MNFTIGVATVWDGAPNTRFSCSVLLWCQAAGRLTAALGSSTPPIIIGTSTPSEDCPHARYIWPEAAARALKTHYEPARRSVGNVVNLLKIYLFALNDLDLVLYTDLDVDCSPPRLRRDP